MEVEGTSAGVSAEPAAKVRLWYSSI